MAPQHKVSGISDHVANCFLRRSTGPFPNGPESQTGKVDLDCRVGQKYEGAFLAVKDGAAAGHNGLSSEQEGPRPSSRH